MKLFKKLFALTAVIILCLSFSPISFAGNDASYYAGKTWDEVVNQVFTDLGVTEDSIAVGYCNLVTGDEYYLNGDRYITSASMYKLPLNMYYAELIHNGELDWASRFPNNTFEQIRDQSLILSDNAASAFLYENGVLNSYSDYRRVTAPYMGVDYDNADPEFYENNLFTARQFIQCLKHLYYEQESFPGIIETMRLADTDRFFMLNEPRFKIAHKYGYITNENNITFMNDCGLAFTSQPIAIVMFTINVPNAEQALTEYCTAMCEYTEYLAAQAAATPEPTEAPQPEITAAPVAAVEPTPAPLAEQKSSPMLTVLFIAAFLVFGIVAAIVLSSKYKLSFVPLFLAAAFCACAMLLALIGSRIGTIYAKPDGDPRQTVRDFFDGVISEDYAKAYKQLKDYTSLGIETPPQSESGNTLYKALHSSFSYELVGDCETDKLTAYQTVSLRYLHLPSLEADVSERTQALLMEIVQSRPTSQVYDSKKNFLPEVANEAYIAALQAVLENAEDYYSTAEIQLELNYLGGRWQLLANPALLKALNGSISY